MSGGRERMDNRYVRVEPLGRDRHNRIYWTFEQSDVWVQELTRPDGSADASRGEPAPVLSPTRSGAVKHDSFSALLSTLVREESKCPGI